MEKNGRGLRNVRKGRAPNAQNGEDRKVGVRHYYWEKIKKIRGKYYIHKL